MQKRKNQKAKRKPHRVEGLYVKGSTERFVTLHPTKGFRDRGVQAIGVKAYRRRRGR